MHSNYINFDVKSTQSLSGFLFLELVYQSRYQYGKNHTICYCVQTLFQKYDHEQFGWQSRFSLFLYIFASALWREKIKAKMQR